MKIIEGGADHGAGAVLLGDWTQSAVSLPKFSAVKKFIFAHRKTVYSNTASDAGANIYCFVVSDKQRAPEFIRVPLKK